MTSTEQGSGLSAEERSHHSFRDIHTSPSSNKTTEPDNKSSLNDMTGNCDVGLAQHQPATRNVVKDTHSDLADSNIVDWEGADDKANPMNWPNSKKYSALAAVSFNTFMTPLASSMFAPGVPQLMSDFHSTSSILSSFVVSVYLIGFCAGPLLVAPMSEVYGRLVVSHVSNILFFVFSIACSFSTTLPMFIVFRFFMGMAGCTPLTVGAGTIADTITQDRRGAALAIWALGPLLGPALGPIIGGFMTEAIGWRWVFWLLAIMAATVLILYFVFVPETYGPVLLARKTKKLQKETGNLKLRPKLTLGSSPRESFKRAIVRPMKMLIFSPIVLTMSIAISINYSFMYLLFTTFTFVYEDQYGFTSGPAGLTYLGIGIGMLIGLFFVGRLSDSILKKLAQSGEKKPEYRLPLMVPSTLFTPLGLLWYGWATQAKVHWIVPIIGSGLVGIGQVGMVIPVQTYFIDAFTTYAASATAAITVLRSLFGAFVPLAGQPLYDALGLGWGNTLLACISLLMIPVPLLFIKYGEGLRARHKLNL